MMKERDTPEQLINDNFITLRDEIFCQVKRVDEKMRFWNEAMPERNFTDLNDMALWAKAFPAIDFMLGDDSGNTHTIDWTQRTPDEKALYVLFVRDQFAMNISYDCTLEALSEEAFSTIQNESFDNLNDEINKNPKVWYEESDNDRPYMLEDFQEHFTVNVIDRSIKVARKTIDHPDSIWHMWMSGCFRNGTSAENVRPIAKGLYLSYAAEFQFYELPIKEAFAGRKLSEDNIGISNVVITIEPHDVNGITPQNEAKGEY